MKVHVSSIDFDKTFSIHTHKLDTVATLKDKISKKIGSLTEEQVLSFEGAFLEDEKCLFEYEIQHDSLLSLQFRRR